MGVNIIDKIDLKQFEHLITVFDNIKTRGVLAS